MRDTTGGGSFALVPIQIKGSNFNNLSLVVDELGDITLAFDTVFIDRSTRKVNIGSTTETCCTLFVTEAGSIAEVGLQDTSTGAPRWELEALNSEFNINQDNQLGILGIEGGAPIHSLRIDSAGEVGLGTISPQDKLHVLDGNLRIEQTAAAPILNFVAGTNTWEIKQNLTTGRLNYRFIGGATPYKFDPAATENLFRVGVLGASTVDINGDLVVTGTISNPDYVFTPEYALESIEDHAAYMWANNHLPAVGAGQVNAQGQAMVNVATRSQGMLEELEKAHIYIEQLHGEIAQNKAKNEGQLEKIKEEAMAKEAEVQALKSEMMALKAHKVQMMNEMAMLKTLIQEHLGRDGGALPKG